MKYKKAILVSESNKILLVQSKSWVLGSEIQLYWGIRNPANDLNLTPFGIWNSMITRWNPKPSTWNPDSQTVSDYLTWSKFYWRQKNFFPTAKSLSSKIENEHSQQTHVFHENRWSLNLVLAILIYSTQRSNAKIQRHFRFSPPRTS